VQSQQVGVLRTNCVDCLDRTNVVQSLFARKAAEATLRSLLLLDKEQGIEDAFPEVRSCDKRLHVRDCKNGFVACFLTTAKA
jgi:hypothetical protein